MKPIQWASLFLLGCAGGGTAPGAMSADAHRAAAEQEQQRSAAHRAGESVSARADSCGGPLTSEPQDICWSTPNAERVQHHRRARRHEELAVEHRAAATTLMQDEAKACANVSTTDRETSLFGHSGDILSVQTIRRPPLDASPRGVRVVFRAVRGLSVDSLQRVLNCQLARAATLGEAFDQEDPLALRPLETSLKQTDEGVVLEMRSEDREVAAALVRRTRELTRIHREGAAKATGTEDEP